MLEIPILHKIFLGSYCLSRVSRKYCKYLSYVCPFLHPRSSLVYIQSVLHVHGFPFVFRQWNVNWTELLHGGQASAGGDRGQAPEAGHEAVEDDPGDQETPLVLITQLQTLSPGIRHRKEGAILTEAGYTAEVNNEENADQN